MAEIIAISSSPPQSPVLPSRSRPRTKTRTQLSGGPDIFQRCSDNGLDPSELADDEIDALLKLSAIKKRQSLTALPQKSSPVRATAPSTKIPDSSVQENHQFSDSLFDDFELPEQPPKRRKLSPKPTKSLAAKSLAELVVDLSSEAEEQSTHQKPGLSKAMKTSIDELDESGDELVGLPALLKAPSAAPNFGLGASLHLEDNGASIEVFSDDIFGMNDPIFLTSSQSAKFTKEATKKAGYGGTRAALLEKPKKKTKKASNSADSSKSTNSTLSSYSRITKPVRPLMEDLDNILDSSQAGAKSPTRSVPSEKAPDKSTKTSADKQSLANEKRLEKERKAAARETEKEQKRRDKEQKAAEKQRAADIADVNRKRTDKKISVEEMIVELPMFFKGKSVGNKVEHEIKDLKAEFSYYADEVDMAEHGARARSLGNIVRWKRKISSMYDEVAEEWAPLPRTKIVTEKRIVVHLPAETFCLIAAIGPTGQPQSSSSTTPPTEEQMQDNLDLYLTLLRSRYPDTTIILLVEDLTSWHKKQLNAKNREFTAQVRAQADPPEAATSSQPPTSSARQSKKRKSGAPIDLSFITSDLTESLMLHLQLTHQPLHIQHTPASETYKQIIAFTQHLSTRPYRQVELNHNLAHASFCMASGQFKTGQGDPLDTWIKMLEQVNRLTASMARGIVDAGFDGPMQLIEGFKKVEASATNGGRSLGGVTAEERAGREKARLMLQDVKRRNMGGLTGRDKLGPQMSKRLYKVFMGRDEGDRSGIA